MGIASTFMIGEWTVRPGANLLERAGNSHKVEPRSMDLLVCLARRAPEVISAEELIEKVWHGRPVGDNTIYKTINRLRKAFGENSPDLIETIPKRGYRLIVPVEFLPEQTALGAQPRLQTVLLGHRRRVAALALGVALIAAMALYVWLWSPVHSGAHHEARTIAVLPFSNVSGDEYLGEGIAEEIIHALSNGSGLRVIARTSSFQFKDTSAGIREIGQSLGASIILEGSVRRSNGRLRIIAQLVDSEAGAQIWSDAFDGPVEDLIALERAVALAVAGRLMGEAADAPRIAAALPSVADISAYEYYLLGRERLQTPTGLTQDWSIADADRAIEYFRRAIALDPSFARAHASLANALLRRTLIGRGLSAPREIPATVAEEARAAIAQAEALEPSLAEVVYVRGFALWALEGERERGLGLFRQAIALDPNFIDAYMSLGISLRDDEGIAALQTAAQLDPLSSRPHRWLHVRLTNVGRLEEAAAHLARFVELEPDSFPALEASALNQWLTGRPDEAVRILRSGLDEPRLRHDELRIRSALAGIYLDLGDHRRAESELRLIEQSEAPFWRRSTRSKRIQLALAEGRLKDVAALVHAGNAVESLPALHELALYELVIGHDDHARELFEHEDLKADVLKLPRSIRWGYYPAVNAAHFDLKAGNETAAALALESAREALGPALEDPFAAGGAYYVLASIHAIEGEIEQALVALDEAIARGWAKHWYAGRDPNLENLWAEPRFQSMINGLRDEMDRLRLTM